VTSIAPRLTIVVGGYMVGFPLGGMTWHHLNYLLGLHEMGHEVWFLEDSGTFSRPYNPATRLSGEDPRYGIAYLENTFRAHHLPLRYCYYSEHLNTYYGLSESELNGLLARADLLLCISGVTPLRPDRPRPRVVAVIDTDPVFTQLQMLRREALRDYYLAFDAVATFGTLIGTAHCPLPTHGIDWIPTHQPVALEHWPVVHGAEGHFTTIGKWEFGTRDVQHDGNTLRSSKAGQWNQVLDLPGRVEWKLEMAMQSMPPDAGERFAAAGWILSDSEAATTTTEEFRSFVQRSAGEFTVVKEIYARLRSGWFSDRSAVYLASGRPVVTESSGFEEWLPLGEGLFAFRTVEEAADALNRIRSNYSLHSTGARRIAEQYFDARTVLNSLLARIL